MLSPYRGVMHSVVRDWADAVTTDGRAWTLYVRGECLYDDPLDLQDRSISVPDVKYGSWSARTGFMRAPIRLPTFDERVREQGEALLSAVQTHAAALPFPLADRFELWLLHGASGQPLALIASGCTTDDCAQPARAQWTPGRNCMAELPEAVQLHRRIAELAGPTPRAQWFERHADGSGSAVLPRAGAATVAERHLPADRFSSLLIDRDALGADSGRLLDALLSWQSPALLQLPGLTREQRRHFETAACGHALRLADSLPLYPCVLDRRAITAALVEARLRRTHQESRQGSEAVRAMSPDYIEIPDD